MGDRRQWLTNELKRVGMAQRDLAKAVGVTEQTVARWVSGKQNIYQRNMRAIADALSWTPEQVIQAEGVRLAPHSASSTTVDLTTTDWGQSEVEALTEISTAGAVSEEAALRLTHQWLVSPSPADVRLAAGRRVGTEAAAEAQQRVTLLRKLDDFVSGADLLPAVQAELRSLSVLLRNGSYTDSVGQLLLSTYADLCQLTGWTAADAGDHLVTHRTYTAGITAGHAAGDMSAAANAASSLAYHLANEGSTKNAILCAQSAAVAVRGKVPPTVESLILERLAWARARNSDASETMRTLDRVDDLHTPVVEGDGNPEWVYWLTRDEVEVMAGRCLVETGNHDSALIRLTPVVTRYARDRPREAALYVSWLAEAHHGAGTSKQQPRQPPKY